MTKFGIGSKIKSTRIKNGLTQEELANRSELSKGFISQIESDQTSPSIATLEDILECLGTNLQDFFSDTLDEKIVFSNEDFFVKETAEDGRTITWVVPNCQKNDMEPILLELEKGGHSPMDEPHNGEEFGYVLSGSITIFIGAKKYRAIKGESFYFKPYEEHYIANSANSKAKVLWVVTPPSF